MKSEMSWKCSLSFIPLCAQYQKGKIQANTQGYPIIINKEDDLLGLSYFKIKREVLLLLNYSHCVLETLGSI